jgi:hypothetical protein
MQSLMAGIKPMSSSPTIVSIQKSWTNQYLPEDCRITMLRRLFTVYSVGLWFLTSEHGSGLSINALKRLFQSSYWRRGPVVAAAAAVGSLQLLLNLMEMSVQLLLLFVY